MCCAVLCCAVLCCAVLSTFQSTSCTDIMVVIAWIRTCPCTGNIYTACRLVCCVRLRRMCTVGPLLVITQQPSAVVFPMLILAGACRPAPNCKSFMYEVFSELLKAFHSHPDLCMLQKLPFSMLQNCPVWCGTKRRGRRQAGVDGRAMLMFVRVLQINVDPCLTHT